MTCDNDFVNIKDEGKLDVTQFFQTQDDAMQATNAVYGFLRSRENSAFPTQFVFGVPADDVEKGSNPGDASFINAYDNFSYTIADEGVPIFDGLTEGKNYNIPRNTAEEVYNFIIADLTASAEVLTKSFPSSELERVSKGVALWLLSKVYLYEKDWPKAYDTSNQVIAMGYSLGFRAGKKELFPIPLQAISDSDGVLTQNWQLICDLIFKSTTVMQKYNSCYY